MIYKEILTFFLKPELCITNIIHRKKVKNVFNIYISYFIVILIIMGSLFLIFDIQEKNLVTERLKKWDIKKTIIYGVILVPLLEELMFRLPMKYKKTNFTISCFILSFFLSSSFFFNQGFLDFSKNLIERLTFSTIISFLFFFFVSRYSEAIKAFWEKNFSIIFYSFTLIFATIHITNIIEIQNPLIIPLLILPQLISGFLIGFFRIKYGFFYGMLFHSLNNFVSMVIF